MKRYVYMIEDIDTSDIKDMEALLDTLGEYGWELVTILNNKPVQSGNSNRKYFLFKRETQAIKNDDY